MLCNHIKAKEVDNEDAKINLHVVHNKEATEVFLSTDHRLFVHYIHSVYGLLDSSLSRKMVLNFNFQRQKVYLL